MELNLQTITRPELHHDGVSRMQTDPFHFNHRA
jgi:hypothetical protein